jgi:DNA-binding transcriptional MerR regulator
VREQADNEAAVTVAVTAFGGLDVAFLNAGVSTTSVRLGGPAWDLAAYRRALGVNVDGIFSGVNAALPALRVDNCLMAAGLTVGDFSRATHLSVKTLRHYDQVGLLEPAAVNPDTGYRYYSAGQIPAAQVIRRLRDLEMPVADVKAVLAAPDAPARNALITAHLNRLEAELAQTRTVVESLRILLQPPGGPAAIEHRSVPATAAAAIEAAVDRADLLAWWQGALGELGATVRAQGLHATGPSGGVFASELLQQDRGQAIVFIPVPGRVRPCSWRA